MIKLLSGLQIKISIFMMYINLKQDGFSNFQFISSWDTNFESWKIQKKIPIKIIRYEDLLNETYAVFNDVINFIHNNYK
jgi:hypothetical protein